ncbi:5-oxoprolinase subunit PxpA [Microbulbifer pacificus]|uniref:5-oxoprolinase subunit PxpA n=1 Tax=Microbulbifer pacificus TaxID=407164 RepID=A0AAU0N1R9_9GAMM|nr:5-oxoprolinase subunit PxpA [Microbulbifer pacificus]WOX06730.1 5-oxoprolinase subunit PxpA [Microbulbifer pacificus]
MQIDINCDLGEGVNIDDCARDAVLMGFISRCNIACGGHAGDDTTMALTVENALKQQIAIGAHPGYPDRDNFGRKSLTLPESVLLQSIAKQIESLYDITARANADLSHVKLHGALYNDAEGDPKLAHAIVALFHKRFPQLTVLGLANAAMEKAARDLGQPFLREGFMDRRYLNDHQLAPRSQAGAVIDDFVLCRQQTMCLIKGETFSSIEGKPLAFTVDSICLHSDNPQALHIASRLQQALHEADIRICA